MAWDEGQAAVGERAVASARAGSDAAAGPGPVVPCVAVGSVGELARAVQEPGFFSRCVARYAAAGFGAPSEGEVRSWRASWPPLLAALMRAGLSGLRLYLEYGTPGGGQRLDALLVGRAPDGTLVLVVVELKQWHSARVLDAERVQRADGVVSTHPVHQVLAYRQFFRLWRPADAPPLRVGAVVVLHNATREQARGLCVEQGEGAGVPVVSGEDLALDGPELAALLGCGGLDALSAAEAGVFERIVWTPSRRLLAQVGAVLEGQTTFALVGDQQHAFVEMRALVRRLLDEGDAAGAVITVAGGPGSGKTALAVRLLGHLMRHRRRSRPRFVTPSGTLRAHLLEAAGGQAQARDLFPPVSSLNAASRSAGSVIIDEAQRLARRQGRMAPELVAVIKAVPLVVVFLDERQTIRPGEGTTVAEIAAAAAAAGRTHHHLELTGSFRCTGSAAYTSWVDDLLYDTPVRWEAQRVYDLAVAEDPFRLQGWIDEATAAGLSARTTAGFCWPWTRTRPRGASSLPLDVCIDVPRTPGSAAGRSRTWKAAWNAATVLTGLDGTALAPHNQLWATHTGGHQQIGCIYSAQGLEYHHSGVIIGPDLTWTNGRWTAHPEQSHDPVLRQLAPEEYLPLALNTYRVLLTRGTHATRIHATHRPTHEFLDHLLH